MMIVDAVNSAPSQHAVYFLVTAYMESLRHFERACGLPQRVLALPVTDAADLGERLAVLGGTLDAALESIVVVSEVGAVLTSALTRLEALGDAAPCRVGSPALNPARIDTRHSSLSV